MDDWKVRLCWGESGKEGIDNNGEFGLFVVDYGLDGVSCSGYELYVEG